MLHQAHLLEELRDIVRVNVSDDCSQLRALVIIDMVERNANLTIQHEKQPLTGNISQEPDRIASKNSDTHPIDVCDTPFSVDSTNFNFQTNRSIENDENAQSIEMSAICESEAQLGPRSKRGGAKLKGSVLLSFDEALDENCQRLQRRRRRASLTVLSASDINAARGLNVSAASDSANKPSGVSPVKPQPLAQVHLPPFDGSTTDSTYTEESREAFMASSSPSAESKALLAAISVSPVEVKSEEAIPLEGNTAGDTTPSALAICAEAKRTKTKPARSRRKSISAGKHAKLKKTVLQAVMESTEGDSGRDSLEGERGEGGCSGDMSGPEPEPELSADGAAAIHAEEATMQQDEPEAFNTRDEEQFLDMDIDDYVPMETAFRSPETAMDSSPPAPAQLPLAAPGRRALYNPATSGLSNEWEDEEETNIDSMPVSDDCNQICVEGSIPCELQETISFLSMTTLPAARAVECLEGSLSQISSGEVLQSAAGLVMTVCLATLMGTTDVLSENDYHDLGSALFNIAHAMTKCNITPAIDEFNANNIDLAHKKNKRVRFTALGGSADGCVSPPNDRRPESISSVDGVCRELSDFVLSIYSFDQKFDSKNDTALQIRWSIGEIIHQLSSSAAECNLALGLLHKALPEDMAFISLTDSNNEESEIIRRVMTTASILELEIFGRKTSQEPWTVCVWDARAAAGTDICFDREWRVASEYRHQVAWLATSAIRSRLRWLFDDVPPCYSKPAITGGIKYEDSRSGLFNLLERSEPAAGFAGEKPRGLKLTVAGSATGTNPLSSKRQNEIIYELPLSYLFTCALRQMYDGIMFAYQSGEESSSGAPVSSSPGGSDSEKRFKELLQDRARGEIDAECIVQRIECAQLVLAVEAARRFVANILSIPLVYSVGEEGNVWPIMEEFGNLIARIGQKEDCHFALVSSMRMLEQLVSEPLFDEDFLIQAKLVLNKKLVIDRGMRAGNGVSLEASARLGYADPVKYIKDAITYCPYIHCFPEVTVSQGGEEIY